jgi:hypothetical protein
MTSRGKQPQIFISHAGRDTQFARALSQALESEGLATWNVSLARTTEPIQRELEEALKSSSWYVILLSDDALDSSWVNFELGAAVGQGKHVLPVYLSERARRRSPSVLSDVRGIRAVDLRPRDVASRVAEVVRAA